MYKGGKGLYKGGKGFALCIMLSAYASLATAQTPDGLVGCWPGEGNANDVVHGNDGVLEGTDGSFAPNFNTGMAGQAFEFGGAPNEQVRVPNNTVLEPEAVSVSMWVNSLGETAGLYNYLLAKSSDFCGSASYAMYIRDGIKFYVRTKTANFILSPSDNTIFDGQWRHVVGTYGPGDGHVRLYVDGIEVGTGTPHTSPIEYLNPPLSVTQDLFFGEWPGDNPGECVGEYDGLIDEVQIYNKVLSVAEVQALYSDGARCPLILKVQIDVKPGSDPNCFNINGHGVVPAAILGSDTFDVADVDVNTVRLGSLKVRVRGNKGPLCSVEDVNGDGFDDMVCHFEDDPEFWSPNENATATITGSLTDGRTEFEGTDAICIVP
jgi:hypothetical protein